MKIVGLITEYNPFHNGHLYHIEKAKEITGADSVIVVMSGNYVQRGAPAIMPKHLRAEVALEAGVDVLMELPVCYATGSAEYFAAGAISLFERLGCVDSICFGSECGDYGLLARVAHILADEPEGYRQALKDLLKSGMSFPLARQKALKDYLEDDSLDSVLEQPNNILGIEYIKALYERRSPMKSYTIRRMVSGYHDTELSGSYSSASAIRRLLSYSSQSVLFNKDGMFDEPSMSEVLGRLDGQVPLSRLCQRFFTAAEVPPSDRDQGESDRIPGYLGGSGQPHSEQCQRLHLLRTVQQPVKDPGDDLKPHLPLSVPHPSEHPQGRSDALQGTGVLPVCPHPWFPQRRQKAAHPAEKQIRRSSGDETDPDGPLKSHGGFHAENRCICRKPL